MLFCENTLNQSHRLNLHDRWNFLDLTLTLSIYKLSLFDNIRVPLYVGLRDVKLDKKRIAGSFKTFVSTEDILNFFVNIFVNSL